MNRISVGVDFSRESEIAIEHALAIARRSGAEVVLLHALPLIEPTLADSIATKYRKILIARQKEIRERLTEVLERHRGSGVAISHNLVDGPPAKVLAEAADELDSGLVVVGTHGRSGFNRFLLGSVAEKVVRSARSNVLVTRPSRRPGVYRRVLVPTDFSPAAERALEVAIGVAGDGAEVDVVHYWNLPAPVSSHYVPISMYSETVDQIASDLERSARLQGESLLRHARKEGVALQFDAVRGSPAPNIVERAPGYDLIVMGRRALTRVERWLTASVSETTVRHAPCSVLVVSS